MSTGETFVVTRYGEPVSELRPLQSVRKTFISRDDLARMSGAGVRISPDRFRRDRADAGDHSS